MNDEQNPLDPAQQHEGRTTYDLAKEARQAMEMLQEKLRQEQLVKAQSHQQEGGETTQLHLEITEFPTPLTVMVGYEVTLGRADTVANYTPEIDLTPYGAYRLGISRRHAIIRRQASSLHLVDLGSRNGTSLNGVKLDANATVPLKSGDEITLGNLSIRVTFTLD